ncbi:MAG: GNAT family N-acetyltransferase [Dehalococcoidia bacterium]
MTDLELLEIEIETQWAADHRGRLVRSRGAEGRVAPHLVIAVSNHGQISAIGSEVPDGLAAELQAAVAGGALSPPATPPAAIARCQHLLTDSVGGPVALSSGPSYVIPPGTAFEATAEIHRSDGESTEALRDHAVERAGWSLEEWDLLLDGSYGPWAVAAIGERIISICHTSRLTDRGAEAGLWTDPEFRGQGHGAAATAAWASLMAPSGRHVFYSTSADNVSSQRVAARLRLHPIGWMWQLSAPQIA